MAYEALTWTSGPSTTDQVDGTQCYSLGERFVSTATRNAVGVQWRVPDTVAAPQGGPHAVAIWAVSGGTRVAYKEFTPVTGGYQDVLFDSAVSLTGGATYIACVYTNHYTFRSSASSVTSPSGNINGDTGMLVAYNGGAAGAPIPNTTAGTWFYVSPLVETATGDLTTAATFQATAALTGATQLSTSRANTLSVTAAQTGVTQLSTSRANTLSVTAAQTGSSTFNLAASSTLAATAALTGTTSGTTDRVTSATHTAAASLAGSSTFNLAASSTLAATAALTGVTSGGTDKTTAATFQASAALAGASTINALSAGTLSTTAGLTGVTSGVRPVSPNTPVTYKGWYGLLGIVQEAREDRVEQLAEPEIACPRCGEPLQTSLTGAVFCPFDGYRQRPGANAGVLRP